MDVVILAAGMGSRFGGSKQTEQMDEYGNFIIDYSVNDAIEAGFDKIVFVIKESMYETFKETIGKRIEGKIKVAYAFQKLEDLPEGFTCPEGRVKPWGTAHAIMAARNDIEDDFIIINADDYYGKDTYVVAANYLKSIHGKKGAYANVAFKAANTMTENGSVKRGVVFTDEEMYLTKLTESSLERVDANTIKATPIDGTNGDYEISNDQLVSMNLFAFSKDLLDELNEGFPVFLKENIADLKCEYLIPTVVSDLVKAGKATLKVIPTSSTWYGVTYKEDKDSVVKAFKKMLDAGMYDSLKR